MSRGLPRLSAESSASGESGRCTNRFLSAATLYKAGQLQLKLKIVKRRNNINTAGITVKGLSGSVNNSFASFFRLIEAHRVIYPSPWSCNEHSEAQRNYDGYNVALRYRSVNHACQFYPVPTLTTSRSTLRKVKKNLVTWPEFIGFQKAR
ncbi:hypothetical protein L218DRAFT_1010243 [Marasmius fiardii PR-910]|nr:hypothetical protein L218DRAFT_1010243 [Marasmius fiardii PR-910]